MEERLQIRPTDRSTEGIRWLLMSLLQDAVRCYQEQAFSRSVSGKRLFRQAERWLMEAEVGAAISFEDVCVCLQMDPQYIRTGLKRWRRQATCQAERLASRRFVRVRER